MNQQTLDAINQYDRKTLAFYLLVEKAFNAQREAAQVFDAILKNPDAPAALVETHKSLMKTARYYTKWFTRVANMPESRFEVWQEQHAKSLNNLFIEVVLLQ